MAKWWWRYEHSECPVCGRGGTERFRVYEEDKRGHHFVPQYDQCLEWEALYF